MLKKPSSVDGIDMLVKTKTLLRERRRWPRLPLAIPVFVRAGADTDVTDREILEFATALNVSAGGMLMAVRRSIPASDKVLLEIPSSPLAAVAALPRVARTLRARVLRIQHGEGYNLLGIKFSRPLVSSVRTVKPLRRKAISPE
jgi:PilZ domain